MKRPPFTAGSIFKACVPLWATPSSTPISPVLVKPAGIAPTCVDSKPSDIMVPGVESPVGSWLAHPHTTKLSSMAADAHEIFIEVLCPCEMMRLLAHLAGETIGSFGRGPYLSIQPPPIPYCLEFPRTRLPPR